MNYAANFRTIHDEFSREEWETRIALAACYRLVDCYGRTDLIYNHITARIPRTEYLLIKSGYVIHGATTKHARTCNASLAPTRVRAWRFRP